MTEPRVECDDEDNELHRYNGDRITADGKWEICQCGGVFRRNRQPAEVPSRSPRTEGET